MMYGIRIYAANLLILKYFLKVNIVNPKISTVSNKANFGIFNLKNKVVHIRLKNS